MQFGRFKDYFAFSLTMSSQVLFQNFWQRTMPNIIRVSGISLRLKSVFQIGKHFTNLKALTLFHGSTSIYLLSFASSYFFHIPIEIHKSTTHRIRYNGVVTPIMCLPKRIQTLIIFWSGDNI